MIASFILHAIAVSGLVAVGALALERVLSDRGVATRWVWVASIWTGTLLPVAASSVPASRGAPAGDTGLALAEWLAALPARVPELPSPSIPLALDAPMKGIWVGASVLLLLLLVGAAIRLRGVRRSWGVHRVLGVMVRISRGFGPAVLGIRRPEIVLPRRVLEMEGQDLRLVILHEGEHLAARDTLLLALCMTAAVLMPWNPAVWWQIGRLRLAVEVDCDRRVLARGVHRKTYGDLLLRIGAETPTLLLPLAALSEAPGTQLGRRMEKMFRSARLSSTGTMTALICALCAASLGFVAACDSPSLAGVDETEAGATYSAESANSGVMLSHRFRTNLDVRVMIYLDDELLPVQPELSSLDPDRIERIHVIRGEEAKAIDPEAADGLIRIHLREEVDGQDRGFVLERSVPVSSPIDGATLRLAPSQPLHTLPQGATYSFTRPVGGA